MKITSRFAACLYWILASGISAYGETVYIDCSGDPLGTWQIHSVYQKGSGVYVTKGFEITAQITIRWRPVAAILQMDYPSIALKGIEAIYDAEEPESPIVLYRNGQMPNSYDPERGTGWVDSNALGHIYLRYYPWVYHPELGWLFVKEGSIVGYELTFWLLSPDYGWLWKRPSQALFYHQDSGEFRTISEIVSG